MRSSAPRHVLYLDGWQARRGAGHWQALQAEALVTAGVRVDYPILPDPEHPALAAWAATITPLVTDETVVIAHGLAALAWLRLPELQLPGGTPRAARALLVAPPAPGPRGGDISTRLPLDAASVAGLTRAPSLLVFAADDPWATDAARAGYAALGLDTVVLQTGAHLNESSQLHSWPAALTWVRVGVWPAAAATGVDPNVSVPNVLAARSLAEAVGAVQRLHRPAGRRLGIALESAVPATLTAAAAETLTRAGVTPSRRLARLQPRAGEPATRTQDTEYFVRRFGHEYTTVVVNAPVTGAQRASLEQACAAQGCALVVLPSDPVSGTPTVAVS